MKKFNVIFEVFMADGHPVNETVTVEAGNKKNACSRALLEMSKRAAYSGKFKQIKSVEEVA